MIYLAQSLATGQVVEYVDDPELVCGHGEIVILPVHGACKRIFSAPEVVATDRRKRYDEHYMPVRSDGRLSSMQLPTREQCIKSNLPLAPYYQGDVASFMNIDQAKDYGKRLSDADPHGATHFDF